MYEEEQPGVYYNTAAVIDADGTLPRQAPQEPHPAGEGVLGEVLLPARATSATRCSTPPSAGSASTSATTATSPRAGARSGSPGRRIVFNPSATSRGLSEYLWQPRAARRRGGQRVLRRRDQPGRRRAARRQRLLRPSYFVDPRGQLVGEAASDTDERARRPRPGHGQARRGPRPLGVLPRPPSRHLRPAHDAVGVTARHDASSSATDTVVTATGADTDRRAGGRRADRGPRLARLRPRQRLCVTARTGDRRRPGSTSSRAASTRTPTWRCRSAAPSPRTPSRPGRRAAAWGGTTTIIDFAVQAEGNVAAVRAGHVAREGRRQLRDRLRLPHDRLRRQRRRRSRRWTPASTRASTASRCSWPTRASSTPRRRDPARDAAGRGERRDDHDARRERHRDRRAGRAGAGRGADRAGLPRRVTRPAAARGRGHPPRDRAGQGRRRARSTSSTCRRARRCARWRRRATRGQNVFAETCPQYLFLSLDDLGRPDFEGAKYVVLAAAAARGATRPSCGGACARTTSRSCPPTTARSASRSQKELGRGDFSKIPNGMPGVEHRMDLLHQGVVAGEISLRRWVEITSTTPARMFGLYPRKGTIAPGRRTRTS